MSLGDVCHRVQLRLLCLSYHAGDLARHFFKTVSDACFHQSTEYDTGSQEHAGHLTEYTC